MKRIICASVAALTTFSALTSCGSSAPEAAKDTTLYAETTVESGISDDTTEAELFSTLPEIDLGGATYNILIRDEEKDEFSTEQSGDVIDDAIYKRNADISERFNLTLTYAVEPGNWTNKDTFQSKIRGTVLAGDSTYDIITGQSNIVQPLSVDRLYVNLLDGKYIDFSQPWWVDAYTEGINLNGEVTTVCGDFALSSFSNANVIFFNKSVMDSLSIEYPYNDVLDGTWTFAEFLTLAESATSDLNGDQLIDANDLHGFCGYNNTIQPFFSSCGFEYTKVGADGKRELLTPSDDLVNIADAMNAFYLSDNCLDASKEYKETVSVEPPMAQNFMEGKFLFMGMVLSGIEMLRDMDVDFGILPYPKLNEKQENYYTTILRRYTVAAVPVTAKDSDASGLILEAMGCAGYKNIVPVYYEIALKGKYTRDDASSMILDIIKGSLWLEFVDLYYSDLGFSDFFSSYVMSGKNGTYVSTYEKQTASYKAKLEKLYESFEG